jgi:hypothetical protein
LLQLPVSWWWPGSFIIWWGNLSLPSWIAIPRKKESTTSKRVAGTIMLLPQQFRFAADYFARFASLGDDAPVEGLLHFYWSSVLQI